MLEPSKMPQIQSTKRKLVSIVIPVFNEEAHLYENVLKIASFFTKNTVQYELILIDDGSTDHTWDICLKIAEEIKITRSVRFTRNFGKEAAFLCGLQEAKGDAVIVMDSDLQHPPEMISKMVEVWLTEDVEVVEARKRSRGNEAFYQKWLALGFYAIMRSVSGFNLAGASDFKLLTKEVVNAYIDLGERNRFFRGLIEWFGFRKAVVYFDVPLSITRKSRWSFVRLLRLSLDAITSFSHIPLQLVSFLGIVALLISIVLSLQTLYMKWSGKAVEGFTTVILIVLMCGSIIMISLGIIGEYLARIYMEIKTRPPYVVMTKSGSQDLPTP